MVIVGLRLVSSQTRLLPTMNTSPSDSFVSYLNSHLGYSAGEFQALQLIVLAVFGAVD